MSQHFRFLRKEWPELYEASTKAENLAHPDPRAACFYTSAPPNESLGEKAKALGEFRGFSAF